MQCECMLESQRPVLLPTCVEFYMAVPAPLVFKETTAEGTLERQLVTVDLLMALQVAQTAKGGPER